MKTTLKASTTFYLYKKESQVKERWIRWGFGNDRICLKLKPLFSNEGFYVSVKNMEGNSLGGVHLYLKKRKKLQRSGLVFTAPTFSQGLDLIHEYFSKK